MVSITSTHVGTARAAVCGLAVGVALLFAPSLAFADTAAEVQAEADAALASLNNLQDQLSQASEDYEEALYQRDEAEAKATEAQGRIDETNTKIFAVQSRLGDRASSMYRSGTSSFLDLILGATTFSEFANNLSMLNILNQNDADLVQQSKDLRAQVQEEKAEYDAQRAAADDAVAEAERIKSEGEAAVASIQATYDSLSAEAAELVAAEEAAAAEAAAQEQAAAAAAAGIEIEASGDDGASGGSSSSSSSYDAYVGSGVVDRAQHNLGASYVWGACSPGAFDCSGFVSYCLTGSYSRLGTTYTFMGWPQVSDPQPGDVCVNSGHCGIYIGGGQMIHAGDSSTGVIVGPVQSGMIYVRY